MSNRIKRGWIVVVALALAGVAVPLAAAGSGASRSNGTIPLLRVGKTSFLDGTQLSLEPLQVIGSDHRVHPWLAQSVTQPSPTIYVYHLRHGVKFWDGQEMTSADVVASWKYDNDPKRAAYAFSDVKSIRAPGKYTVVVTLKEPAVSWPYQVANFALIITEKKFIEAHYNDFGHPNVLVMGTGPWKLLSLGTTSQELEANPHYWGGKVLIKHISVQIFKDETSEALAFRAGDLDVAIPNNPVSFASYGGIHKGSSSRLVSVPSGSIYLFAMNTQVAPWNDVHLRRAVAYALNAVDLAKANGGFATIVHTVISPYLLQTIATPAQVKAALKAVPIYSYNAAKAKQELALSAYPNGLKTSVEAAPIDNYPQVNEVLATELKDVGIDVTVNQVDLGKYYADITSGPSTRPATYIEMGTASPDPSVFNWAFGSTNAQAGQWNISSWVNTEQDRLLAASVATSDPAKRLVAYAKLLRLMGQQVPYVPLFTQRYTLALANGWTWRTFDPYYSSRPWALEIKKG
jgi:peptide/nickel transport system substrate-binding protein